MKSRFTILLLFASILVASSGAAQTSDRTKTPDAPALSEEQESLFDVLLEREIRRDPQSARIVQEDPSRAAEMAEVSDPEIPDGGSIEFYPRKSPVIGTFIQLTRKWATLSEDDWSKVLDIVEYAGMTRIIIQWSAYGDIAYFEPAPETYTETYPVINRLFSALENRNIEVVLGLSNDPNYWKTIETRNDVRDVYFRVRNTRNLWIQEALLEQFDSVEAWTGYYIAEEIDDLNWREPDNEEVFHQFLLRTGRIIRERDEKRALSISSFFRKRTAPSTYANNLADLMVSTRIDQLWIQDGIGVEPLSTSLIEPYYQILRTRFNGLPTSLGTIAELFETTSAPSESFTAQTALPERVERQFRDASILGGPVIVFSLFDYADPRAGGIQREVYELIRAWNLEALPSISKTADPIDEPVQEEEPSEEINSASEILNDLRQSRSTPQQETGAPPKLVEPGTPPSQKPSSQHRSEAENDEAARIQPITGLRIPIQLFPPPNGRAETTPQESPNP